MALQAEEAVKMWKIFRALGNETRLKIVRVLLNGEKSVCEIASHIGRPQPTVSLQLKKLAEIGIVRCKREGKRVIYRIAERDILENVIKIFSKLCEDATA